MATQQPPDAGAAAESQWTPADREFMRLALAEAKRALDRWEVPVGCVIVRDGVVVAAGSNSPNLTRNATRHAELEAIDTLLTAHDGDAVAAGFDRAELYVTCEPCIMCAAALSLLRLRRVVFGCSNDRFGGCGSVLAVHEQGVVPCGSGDARGDAQPLAVRGGLHAQEAVELLRAFYLRGNPNAPKPHRTLQLDLDVSTLGAPGAAQGCEQGETEGACETSAAAGART